MRFYSARRSSLLAGFSESETRLLSNLDIFYNTPIGFHFFEDLFFQ